MPMKEKELEDYKRAMHIIGGGRLAVCGDRFKAPATPHTSNVADRQNVAHMADRQNAAHMADRQNAAHMADRQNAAHMTDRHVRPVVGRAASMGGPSRPSTMSGVPSHKGTMYIGGAVGPHAQHGNMGAHGPLENMGARGQHGNMGVHGPLENMGARGQFGSAGARGPLEHMGADGQGGLGAHGAMGQGAHGKSTSPSRAFISSHSSSAPYNVPHSGPTGPTGPPMGPCKFTFNRADASNESTRPPPPQHVTVEFYKYLPDAQHNANAALNTALRSTIAPQLNPDMANLSSVCQFIHLFEQHFLSTFPFQFQN